MVSPRDVGPTPLLLIDDDPGAFRYVAQIVNRIPGLPYRVIWSPTARDGLGHLEHAGGYAGILIDYDLGGHRSGLDLLRDLRASDLTCPLIMLTADTTPDLESSCMQAGADDYLIKDELAPTVLHRALMHAHERRAFLATLLDQQERYRQLARNFPQGAVIVLDSAGTCQIAEGDLLTQIADPATSLVGRRIGTCLPEPIATFIADHLPYGKRDSTTDASHECLIEARHYLLRMTSLNGTADGGSMVVISDITDLRSAEQALVHSARLASVGTLACGVAHELTNLHGLIIGNLDRLRRIPALGPEIERRIDTVEGASHRAAEISRNLMGFGRGCSLGFTLTPIDSIIREAVDLVHYHFAKLDISLATRLCHAPPMWLQPSAIGQVLINLFINAEHAMSESADRRISVSTRMIGATLELRVSDTGCGMSEEVRRHIFEPFFTTKTPDPDSDPIHRVTGTGLGLTVVKTVVANHQGRIEVESEPGEGTTFTISLPIEHPVCSTEDRAPATTAPRSAKPSVLVVEDDDSVREIIAEMLAENGFRVTQAEDGRRAEHILDRQHIDVVLVDLLMPHRTGWQLIDQAATLADPPAIVVISGLQHEDLSPRQMGLIDEFLHKPIDLATLCNTVADIASRRSL